jgi:hypothetical protein
MRGAISRFTNKWITVRLRNQTSSGEISSWAVIGMGASIGFLTGQILGAVIGAIAAELFRQCMNQLCNPAMELFFSRKSSILEEFFWYLWYLIVSQIKLFSKPLAERLAPQDVIELTWLGVTAFEVDDLDAAFDYLHNAYLIYRDLLQRGSLSKANQITAEELTAAICFKISEIHLCWEDMTQTLKWQRKAQALYETAENYEEAAFVQFQIDKLSKRSLCDCCYYHSQVPQLRCAVHPSGPVNGQCVDFMPTKDLGDSADTSAVSRLTRSRAFEQNSGSPYPQRSG